MDELFARPWFEERAIDIAQRRRSYGKQDKKGMQVSFTGRHYYEVDPPLDPPLAITKSRSSGRHY